MKDGVRFTDAHHHLWIPCSTDPDLGYGWLRDIGAMKPFGDPTPIQRDYEWPEYASESDRHTMLGSVYVQVDGAIADPVAETAWVQSVFDQSELSHGIVSLVDLSLPTAEAMLTAHARFAAFKGVRQILSRLDDTPKLCFAPVHYLHNDQWRDQFGLLEQYQLSFDLQLYPEQMADAAEFFAQHPNVPVIVDHAGSPYDQTSKGLAAWREGLTLLASLEHVSMKFSGFGMFDQQRNVSSIEPMVESLLELFTPERLLYGSNFPVDKLMGNFDDTLDMLDACLDVCACTAEQRQKIWSDNTQRIYRLE